MLNQIIETLKTENTEAQILNLLPALTNVLKKTFSIDEDEIFDYMDELEEAGTEAEKGNLKAAQKLLAEFKYGVKMNDGSFSYESYLLDPAKFEAAKKFVVAS